MRDRASFVAVSLAVGWLACLARLSAQQEPPVPVPSPTQQPAQPSVQSPRAGTPAAAAGAATDPVVLGIGAHRYTWVRGFGEVGNGKQLGSTHGGVVITADGRVLANTDTEHAVVAFAADGRIVGTWGKEFHGGLHGMCIRREGDAEVLYLAHTRRHEVVKTTLDGEVLWTIGWPQASGVYDHENQFAPTAVAVAPDGRIFVADGYGKSWVHVFDRERNYVMSFGGPGTALGKLQTPHGLWIDGRGKEPLLLVCDRENHRLQWFTLQGEAVRVSECELQRPCNVAPLRDGGLAVADLCGRVTILDAKDQLVCHLGEQPDQSLRAVHDVQRDKWVDGRFHSPHGIACGADGSLYVAEWNSVGRIVKLQPVPVAPAKAEPAPEVTAPR